MFKPCGWYKEHCDQVVVEQTLINKRDFKPHRTYDINNVPVIESNTDYPGMGNEHDMHNGELFLVQFDIGLHEKIYEKYQAEKAFDGKELLRTDTFLDISNVYDKTTGEWNYDKAASIYSTEPQFGEFCFEIMVHNQENWDSRQKLGKCMGTCGVDCSASLPILKPSGGVGDGKDCMKHDICLAFKDVLGFERDLDKDFCMDWDCGDEAAQTLLDCYEDNVLNNPAKKCTKDYETDKDKHLWESEMLKFLPSSLIDAGGMRSCLSNSGWEMGQGIPHNDGEECSFNDQCTSRNCYDGWGVGTGGNECKPIVWYNIEDRAKCMNHRECKSKYCHDGWTGDTCESTKRNGEGCGSHDECASKYCMDGFGFGNGGNKCEKYPLDLDSYCKEHEDCQSEFCSDGITYNSCRPQQDDGYKGCSENEECKSGGCMDGYGIGYGGNVCKQFPFVNGDYCHKHPECESDFCAAGVAYNSCESKKPNGYMGCGSNQQCESGGCMDGYGVGNGGNECRTFPFRDGSYCSKHSDCSSSFCAGGVLHNTCKSRKNDGQGCADHADCKSNFCMDGYGIGNGGNSCEAYPLSRGKYCNKNNDCQSNKCSGWFHNVCK